MSDRDHDTDFDGGETDPGRRGDRGTASADAERPLESPTAPIAVENVSLSFGDLSVLEDVSLTVEPGEFVGLVGPNGAGKTSLLRTISGALEPDAGTVTIDGTDVHAVSSRASSRLVAVVPQDTTLSFSFDVRDVVEMGRHPHRSRFSSPTPDDREAVERALERTRTTDLADRPIDEVSGGQRQRVVLARAIAQATPALLLDEPTASLDVNHQVETLELVRELVADGRTAVAAIHDLELAARYCDRLVLLADGSVSRDGPPSDVLTADALADAFDATAAVTTNPITGTEAVTALPAGDDLEPLSGGRNPTDPDARVHVLGSGPTAANVLARLEPTALEVSFGPVVSTDAAMETARRLDVETLAVDPFTPLSTALLSAFEERVRDADVTILADPVIGRGNGNENGNRSERVLEILETDATNSLVVVDRQPAGGGDDASKGRRRERDGASDERRERFAALRDRGRETTPETVLEAVASVLEERSVASDRNSSALEDGTQATSNETATESESDDSGTGTGDGVSAESWTD